MDVSEPLLRDREIPFGRGYLYPAYRKGTRLIFLGHRKCIAVTLRRGETPDGGPTRVIFSC
jgi:hypothetical protein